MSKRRSRLLTVSLLCVTGLVAGPPLAKWRGAPWNRPHARPLMAVKAKSRAFQLALSADGRVVTALQFREPTLQWASDGSTLHPGIGYADAISPDGALAARIKIKNLSTGRLTTINTISPVDADPYDTRCVELAETRSGRVLRTLRPPRVPGTQSIQANQVDFSPDGKYIALQCAAVSSGFHRASEYSVIVWETRSGHLVWSRVLRDSYLEYMNEVRFDPGGDILVPLLSRESPEEMKHRVHHMYSLRSGLPVFVAVPAGSLENGSGFWKPTAISARGSLFAGCSGDYDSGERYPFTVWDLKTQSVAWSWPEAEVGAPCVAFSPDEKMLAIGTWGTDEIILVDARSGQRIATLNESTLLLRSRRRLVNGWNSMTRPLNKIGIHRLYWYDWNSGIHSPDVFAWSADSRRLAASYYDNSVKVWAVPAAP